MQSCRIFIILGLVSVALATAHVDSVFIRSYRNLKSSKDFKLNEMDDLFLLLDKSENLAIYLHGWKASVNSWCTKLVVRAYLNHTKENIVAIDYSQAVSGNYRKAVADVDPVAIAIASALDKLVSCGWNQENIHIVGHSMGGQVAARIGRNTMFRIPRITGLDPSGRVFDSFLSSGDAKCVDVIHTDKGGVGQLYSTADIDFQPNGGHRVQPGCPILKNLLCDGDRCSHHRSYLYYAESLRNPDAFYGVLCPNEFAYMLGCCDGNEIARMGHRATCLQTKGSYYLQTNSKSPFGLGIMKEYIKFRKDSVKVNIHFKAKKYYSADSIIEPAEDSDDEPASSPSLAGSLLSGQSLYKVTRPELVNPAFGINQRPAYRL